MLAHPFCAVFVLAELERPCRRSLTQQTNGVRRQGRPWQYSSALHRFSGQPVTTAHQKNEHTTPDGLEK